MRKRNSSKVSVALNPSGSHLKDDSNVIKRNELFTFPNGDKYEGEYRINGEQPFLVRQGRGVYDTNDFNKYEANWEQDKIGSDLHVRYNNGMEYKGNVDKDGTISGPGSYCFPDRSSIEAISNQNKPVLDIQYKEPLGYTWRGQLSEDGDTHYKIPRLKKGCIPSLFAWAEKCQDPVPQSQSSQCLNLDSQEKENIPLTVPQSQCLNLKLQDEKNIILTNRICNTVKCLTCKDALLNSEASDIVLPESLQFCSVSGKSF